MVVKQARDLLFAINGNYFSNQTAIASSNSSSSFIAVVVIQKTTKICPSIVADPTSYTIVVWSDPDSFEFNMFDPIDRVIHSITVDSFEQNV